MSAVLKNFSENLKIRMSTQGVEVVDQATVTGLSLPAIYQYLDGKMWPRPAQVELLCQALFCTPADLFREPIALTRPNWPEAWKVMAEFMESLTPATRRLLFAASALDDPEIIRFAAMMEKTARTKQGEPRGEKGQDPNNARERKT